MRRMLAAFTYRDFRVQWIGACTSSIGTWMQIVAQNWLVVSLTNSPFFLGLDAFLQQLPIILFSLIGGVFADRYDRRRTLMMSQVIQMSTSGALALLMYFRAVQIWQILALSFVTGCAQSFGGPAYNSLIPSLVDKKDLPNAVALNSIQFNVARVLGPLLFGLTLSAFRHWGYSEPQAMNACFLLNSLSFLDRKSTRLNSSHANISYAVFCLKKKTSPNLRQANAKTEIPSLRSKPHSRAPSTTRRDHYR